MTYLRWLCRIVLVGASLYALSWCFAGLSSRSNAAVFGGLAGVVAIVFLVLILWGQISKIGRNKNEPQH
jgi:hypothetical protein